MPELLESDFYYTIQEPKVAEITVTKSRFIGHAFSVSDAEEAMEKLNQVRIEHYNANHNCWAYYVGGNALEHKFSDDGEPNGTAGKHILFSINKAGLSDALVVVTRYFGGKKLGKGNLGRAYADAANEVLSLVEKKKVILTKKIEIFSIYEDINVIKRLLSEYAQGYKEEYTDSVYFLADLPNSLIDSFTEQLTQLTNGRAGWKLPTY